MPALKDLELLVLSRYAIIAVETYLAKRTRDQNRCDLDALGDASDRFSGAEIEQAGVSTLYPAFSRSSELERSLVVDELRATRPRSVTRAEELQALREGARDRTVPAS